MYWQKLRKREKKKKNVLADTGGAKFYEMRIREFFNEHCCIKFRKNFDIQTILYRFTVAN